MTQHILMKDTQEDARTLKSLGVFIAMFAGFSLCLALGVTFFAP